MHLNRVISGFFYQEIKMSFSVNGYAGLFQLNNAGDAKQSYLHNTPKRTSVIKGQFDKI